MRNANFTEIEWILATHGMGQPMIEVAPSVTANTFARELGHKQYELSNYLGNCASPYASPKRCFRDSQPVSYETGVLEVVCDVKIIVQEGRHALEVTGEMLDYGDNAWAKFVEIVNSYGTPSE